MAVEGSLDLFQLPEILQVVSQQNKTGILTIQGADDIVAISFLNGRIVAADSLTETTEKGVGEVLVGDGLVDASTLRRLSDQSVQDGTRLGDLLISGGMVDREQFLAALRVHTLQLLMSLLEWDSGEFKFYGGDEVSYEEGFRAIGVDELLLRAIEESEQPEREALPDPAARLSRIESSRSIKVRAVDEIGDEILSPGGDVLWLTPEEDRVLREVAPERTVEDVAIAAEVPLDRVRYVLYRLSREGVIGPAAEPAVEAASGAEAPLGTAAGAPAPVEPAIEPPVSAPAPLPVEMPTPEQLEQASPVPVPRPKARPPRAPVRRRAAGQGLPISGLLALVLVALVLVVLLVAPGGLLTPFPWLGTERAALLEGRDTALRLKIDEAAKTFFLVEGRFPDSLNELVARNLLDPFDVVDAQGHTLAYDALDGTYEVRSIGESEVTAAAGGATREGINGNFLLDPEFVQSRAGQFRAEAPLVLLD